MSVDIKAKAPEQPTPDNVVPEDIGGVMLATIVWLKNLRKTAPLTMQQQSECDKLIFKLIAAEDLLGAYVDNAVRRDRHWRNRIDVSPLRWLRLNPIQEPVNQ